MGLTIADLPAEVRERLADGTVIPAHPLALNAERELDVRRQRALSRYYLDAGAGGLAVGAHTTQFEIRDVGLYEPVLKIAAETVESWTAAPVVKVAGLVGPTAQAVAEAEIARGLGYHAGLLSLAAFKNASEDEMIAHCRRVADEMPLMGFYLQPAVGGATLPHTFWRRFAEIENVIAIKIAPFDRYATLDVVRGVVEAHAEERVTLYTGNDDAILADLVTPYPWTRDGETVLVPIAGGLLGHWSVWTKTAVELWQEAQEAVAAGQVPVELLALGAQVTDCNSAFFDVANAFHGCIAGCHEVLRRQGLLEGTWCLNPDEGLSPGQATEIDRIYEAYPALNDDAFITENLERWLAD